MRIAIVATPYPLAEFPSPPLGVTYVAAAFEAAGAEVQVFDYIVTAYTKEKLHQQLESFRPDAVGATSVTMNFSSARKILQDAKEYDPSLVTLMGGPHVSFTATDTLNRYPYIDMIVIGEGEATIAEYVPAFKQRGLWHGIRGIAFRDGSECVVTGKREFIADVDTLPLPARHLLPISRYLALGFDVSIITGRGCPNACIFCLGRRMVGAKVRKRKTGLILDEIEEILSYGFEHINIADDLFTAQPERVREFCNGIRERSPNLKWSAFARVDTVNQEMLDMMAAAGCDGISFGVESGNRDMLRRIKKGIKLEQVTRATEMCRRAGIWAHESFIIGLPGETMDTLTETDRFAKSTGAVYNYHYLAPFPGTTVRDNIQDYDLAILTDNWDRYDANAPIVSTSALTPHEMQKFGDRRSAEIDSDWDQVMERYRQGTCTPDEKMQVDGRRRTDFTFDLLSNDLIEKCGFVESTALDGSDESALRGLCSNIIKYTKSDSHTVLQTLSDFARRGYLKTGTSKDGCRWTWSEDKKYGKRQ